MPSCVICLEEIYPAESIYLSECIPEPCAIHRICGDEYMDKTTNHYNNHRCLTCRKLNMRDEEWLWTYEYLWDIEDSWSTPIADFPKNLRNILEYAQSNSNVSGFLAWLDEDFTSLAYKKPVYRFFPHMENYHFHKSQMIHNQTLQHALMQFSKP